MTSDLLVVLQYLVLTCFNSAVASLPLHQLFLPLPPASPPFLQLTQPLTSIPPHILITVLPSSSVQGSFRFPLLSPASFLLISPPALPAHREKRDVHVVGVFSLCKLHVPSCERALAGGWSFTHRNRQHLQLFFKGSAEPFRKKEKKKKKKKRRKNSSAPVRSSTQFSAASPILAF